MTKVAIVGGGAAGIGASRTLLEAGFDVTLLEPAPRLGGNCVGVPVRDRSGKTHWVDAGVSDFNRNTFSELTQLIDELGMPTHPICQDADFVGQDGFSQLSFVEGKWSIGDSQGEPDSLLFEMNAFRARAVEVLHDPRFHNWSVGRYLRHIGCSRDFARLYILPRAMGSFPMPAGDPVKASIVALVRFWQVHGLVGATPGDRHCVTGGMHRYVEAYTNWFRRRGGTLRCGTRVMSVARSAQGVVLGALDQMGGEHLVRADHVVFACHARQALALLEKPTPQEWHTLGRFACQKARVVVHQDDALLGADSEKWGAFNYLVPQGDWPQVRPTITFFPNRLASLAPEVPDTFVTMNPAVAPDPAKILLDRSFLHPILTSRSEALASEVEAFQGEQRTWFAGSHLVAPAVHESALLSGMHAASLLLGERPTAAGRWTSAGLPAARFGSWHSVAS